MMGWRRSRRAGRRRLPLSARAIASPARPAARLAFVSPRPSSFVVPTCCRSPQWRALRWALQIDGAQRERERRQRRRQEAQHQKHVDIAQIAGLLLNACADPAERGLRRAAAMQRLRGEIAFRAVQRLVIERVPIADPFGKSQLMKLLALGEHHLRKRTPIEPPKLRARLISAEAWSVFPAAIPS